MYNVSWGYMDSGEIGSEDFDNYDDALEFFNSWSDGVETSDIDVFYQTLKDGSGKIIESFSGYDYLMSALCE
jgi:hypothetical protein